MLDKETFEAMRALHIAFVEGRDFPTLLEDEPPSAEIETSSWSNNFRSMVMIGVTLIVCSALYLSIARQRHKSFEATIKGHPRRRLSLSTIDETRVYVYDERV
jgi:hypothetical protein